MWYTLTSPFSHPAATYSSSLLVWRQKMGVVASPKKLTTLNLHLSDPSMSTFPGWKWCYGTCFYCFLVSLSNLLTRLCFLEGLPVLSILFIIWHASSGTLYKIFWFMLRSPSILFHSLFLWGLWVIYPHSTYFIFGVRNHCVSFCESINRKFIILTSLQYCSTYL